MRTLVLVKDRFVKVHALGEKVDLWTVHPPSVDDLNMGIGAATMSMVFTVMMLESDVKVHLKTFSGFSFGCCINREKGYLLP